MLDGVRKGRWGRVGVGRGAARGVCAGTSGRKGLRFELWVVSNSPEVSGNHGG